jgi:hypothetical protein
MGKSILGFLLVAILLSCSSKNTSDGQFVVKMDFKGVTDIYLDEDTNQDKPAQSVLRIRKTDKDGEVLYTLATKTNFSKAMRLGNVIYVSVYDSAKSDGNFSLLKLDLINGTVQDTGIRLFDDFEFSEDGLWICYVFNDHATELSLYPGSKVYFPVIFLEKLEGGEKYKFDMVTEMTDWPTFAEIKCKGNSFTVEYYQDSPTPLRTGIVSVVDHSFKWLD